MRHACHKPRNLRLMSVRMFKRGRADGIQTLLGVIGGGGAGRDGRRWGGSGGFDGAHVARHFVIMTGHLVA